MKGLFCFDMEGVLLEGEILNEVGARKGVGPIISELTRKAMEGETDFETALRKRVDFLKGLDIREFKEVVKSIPVLANAREMIAKLKEKGHYTLIVTGSFDVAARIVAEKLGVDKYVAHKLEVRNNVITGNFELSFRDKAEILKRFRAKLKPNFTVAIGDGANDLNMLKEADIGIAFKAKNVLRDNSFVYCEDAEELIRLLEGKGSK